MNTLRKSIRRRMSSNASSNITEPDNDDSDPQPLTLPVIAPLSPMPSNTFMTFQYLNPSPPGSRHSAASSSYYLAPEYQRRGADDWCSLHTTYCQADDTHDGFYPLERQTPQRIRSLSEFHAHQDPRVMVFEVRENTLNKVSRRVSVVGRQARRLSGGLTRTATKLLGLSTTPDLVRRKQREPLDDTDEEWRPINHGVDLGREVQDIEQEAVSGQQMFGQVQWATADAIVAADTSPLLRN